MTDTSDWRERLKEKRREEQKQRRAALAADPRVQEMKQALKVRRREVYEQQKQRRKERVAERKELEREQGGQDRARRDLKLKSMIRGAGFEPA